MKYLKLFGTESAYKAYRDGGGTLSPMCPFVMIMEMCIITIFPHLMDMTMLTQDFLLVPYGQQ